MFDTVRYPTPNTNTNNNNSNAPINQSFPASTAIPGSNTNPRVVPDGTNTTTNPSNTNNNNNPNINVHINMNNLNTPPTQHVILTPERPLKDILV